MGILISFESSHLIDKIILSEVEIPEMLGRTSYFAVFVFPPGVKAFVSLRPNSAYSYLLIRSMPFAENISILQERSGGTVRVFVDIKKSPAFKVSAF